MELEIREEEGVPLTKAADPDKFAARAAFWLAAVGCAVGFGNVWRFPYMVFLYGGAGFLFPFTIVLLVVVLPLIWLELGLGQLNQCGLIAAFNSLSDPARVAGLGVMTSFNVLNFYPLLLSWSLIYLVNSGKSQAPWQLTPDERAFCEVASSAELCAGREFCHWADGSCNVATVEKAAAFFEASCNISEDAFLGVQNWSWKIFGGFALLWVGTFIGIAKGARILGYLTYVTMSIPTVILLVLMIVGMSLEGSNIGIKAYVGSFDPQVLLGDVWVAAMGQAIFSMSAGMGTYCGYAAHNEKSQNFVQDGYVIALGDFLFAFVAGFSVFAIAGHLAHETGVELTDLPLTGTALIFQTYPLGLEALTWPFTQIFSVLFFLTLWLLGFSTVIGVTEAIVMTLRDARPLATAGRLKIVAALCGTLFLLNLPYATDLGASFLDVFDHFSAEFSALLFAFLFGASTWSIQWRECAEITGPSAWWLHTGSFFLAATGGPILTVLIGGPRGVAIGIGFLLLSSLGGGLAALLLCRKTDPLGQPITIPRRAFNLYFRGIEELRTIFNNTACTDGTCWRLPAAWSFSIKYLGPMIVLFMWSGGVASPGKLFDYGDFPWVVYLVGSCFPILTVGLAVCGILYPAWMSFLLPAPEARPRLFRPAAGQKRAPISTARTTSHETEEEDEESVTEFVSFPMEVPESF